MSPPFISVFTVSAVSAVFQKRFSVTIAVPAVPGFLINRLSVALWLCGELKSSHAEFDVQDVAGFHDVVFRLLPQEAVGFDFAFAAQAN